jgi:hypothetical protein
MDKNGSERLEALRKREASLRAQIAAFQEQRRRREARESARLFMIVGEALTIFCTLWCGSCVFAIGSPGGLRLTEAKAGRNIPAFARTSLGTRA